MSAKLVAVGMGCIVVGDEGYKVPCTSGLVRDLARGGSGVE